jgi:geranylgeranyl pyrophosphate synthase
MQLPVHLIKDELKVFESRFKEAVQSQTPLLDRIMRFIVKRKGKQLRPMFVLLSAKLCAEVNDSAYRAASLVELLHTATLVHDDVVDDSMERRGFFPLMPLEGKSKRLIGDYLLAKVSCCHLIIMITGYCIYFLMRSKNERRRIIAIRKGPVIKPQRRRLPRNHKK